MLLGEQHGGLSGERVWRGEVTEPNLPLYPPLSGEGLGYFCHRKNALVILGVGQLLIWVVMGSRVEGGRGFFTLPNLGHRLVLGEVKNILHCMIEGLSCC